MNELTRPLTGAEERLWQEKLAALLVRQIALYTANESSSVPAAAARELLRGVLFFLAVPEEADGGGEADRAARIRTLLSCDLADELAHGQQRAQRDAALTIALWRKVVETLPPLENRSLRDTLRSIGRGFRCYDTRFFPQRFDCDIDYQLSQSVSESLLGINYVNQYLARLAAENSLLTRLPQGEVRAVLERSCPDWRGLLVNLYAPAAANVLARTLLGGEGLTLSDGEIGAPRALGARAARADRERPAHGGGCARGAARPPTRRWKISEQLRPRGRRPRRKPARLRRPAGTVRMKEKGSGC